MATAHFESDSRVNDFHFGWTVDWDDTTRDMTVNAFQFDDRNGGQPVGTPGTASIFVTLNNGQERLFDLFALGLVNTGPRVFTNVNLQKFADRSGAIVVPYRTSYMPPAR